MGKYVLELADLKKSATTYSKEILSMPVIAAEETLQHMSPVPGVGGRYVVSQFEGSTELVPYDAQHKGDSNITVASRVLETYLGCSVDDFDSNDVAKTIYGQLTAQGESLKDSQIAQYTLDYLAAQLGKKINMVIFKAKRKEAGKKTEDLFDGFDTITEKEITAGNIAAEKGNYKKLPALTEQNCFDELNKFYEESSDLLQGVPTKLFVPRKVYNMYRRSALDNLGSVVYNDKYTKTHLSNSNDLCELVPLASKKDSKYLHLAPKSNFLYGYGDGLADEKVEIEKHHPFLLTFVATMYFGTQFRSISPEMLSVAELTL